MSWVLPSLLRISVFLILSHFVTPSIVPRHAISNTLSLLFDDSFNVHVSVLYNITLSQYHQDLIYSELREFVYLLRLPYFVQHLKYASSSINSLFDISF